MFDIKWIRNNRNEFDAGLALRGGEPLADNLIALDDKRRANVAQLQHWQTRRNSASKEIGKAKAGGDDGLAQKLIDEVAQLKQFIHNGEELERQNARALNDALSSIPNLPYSDIPVGNDEADNVLQKMVGERNRNWVLNQRNILIYVMAWRAIIVLLAPWILIMLQNWQDRVLFY